jgi:hypothetical protein
MMAKIAPAAIWSITEIAILVIDLVILNVGA